MEFIGALQKSRVWWVKVGCDPSRFLEARRKKPYPLVHVSSTADLTLILLGVFGPLYKALGQGLLGGSWVVISRVISRVTILITHIKGLSTWVRFFF